MRRFLPLFTTPKPPSPSPNVTVKGGPHSDALWKLCKDLVDIDSPPSSEGASGRSSGVYYITDTILDLDADKSPATRPYTSADHEQQIKKWGTNHALDALTKRMHTLRDEVSDAKLAWRRKLGPFERRITERDILVMALLGPFGPSNGSKSQRETGNGNGNRNGNGQLSYDFLERIGIFKRITADDIPLTVRYLAHRVKTQQTQGQPQVHAQTGFSHHDGQLGSRNTDTGDHNASEGISTGTDTTSPETSGQETKKKIKPRTKVQEIKHLKSVLRKSKFGGAQSIPRVLYPLLNDDRGRALIAECCEEIISGMTTKPTQSVAESAEEETTTQAAIFLKNLAYNLVKKGDLALSPDLISVWSKVLDERPLTLSAACTTTAAARADDLPVSVTSNINIKCASSGGKQQHLKAREQSQARKSPPATTVTSTAPELGQQGRVLP